MMALAASAARSPWTEAPAARTLVFVPEQQIHARGSHGSAAWLVTAGLVRVERVTAAGTRRILRVAGPGDLVGQAALLRQPHGDDAVACTAVRLQRVPASLADPSGGCDGDLPLILLQRWQDALDETQTWSAEVSAGPARRRMLQLLLRLQRHADAQDRIWLPRRAQMADMLDMAAETCSRLLSALQREGVLQLVPPDHGQLDGARLQQALDAANC